MAEVQQSFKKNVCVTKTTRLITDAERQRHIRLTHQFAAFLINSLALINHFPSFCVTGYNTMSGALFDPPPPIEKLVRSSESLHNQKAADLNRVCNEHLICAVILVLRWTSLLNKRWHTLPAWRRNATMLATSKGKGDPTAPPW